MSISSKFSAVNIYDFKSQKATNENEYNIANQLCIFQLKKKLKSLFLYLGKKSNK